MKYINVDSFGDKVVALTTTLKLGNMAYQVGNDTKQVKEAREEVAKDLGLNTNDFIFTYQNHTTIMHEVNRAHKGMGCDSFASGVYADALYTKDNNVPLCIFHADCVPLFLYVPTHNIVGIIHAGVVGSINEITFKSLLNLIIKEGIDPRDIHLHFGPSLKQEYQVIKVEEVEYLKMHGYDECLNGLHLDKVKLNEMQALRVGVLKENISYCDVDTYEDENLFSFNNKEKPEGRMASIIFLK